MDSAAQTERQGDAAGDLKIGYSFNRSLFLLAVSMAMTGLSALCGLQLVPSGAIAQAFGLVGLGFFGFCTLMIARRFVFGGRAVVTITPEGIRDRRVAAEIIPWTDIRGIATWTQEGVTVLVLDVGEAVESRLTLTKAATWSRDFNRQVGADGLCIATTGLALPHSDILAIATVYAERARGGAGSGGA